MRVPVLAPVLRSSKGAHRSGLEAGSFEVHGAAVGCPLTWPMSSSRRGSVNGDVLRDCEDTQEANAKAARRGEFVALAEFIALVVRSANLQKVAANDLLVHAGAAVLDGDPTDSPPGWAVWRKLHVFLHERYRERSNARGCPERIALLALVR